VKLNQFHLTRKQQGKAENRRVEISLNQRINFYIIFMENASISGRFFFIDK
jgi:hypothetical protein